MENDTVTDNLHRRLRKIAGQVQAIDRMVESGAPCDAVLVQLNAAKSARRACARARATTPRKPSRAIPTR